MEENVENYDGTFIENHLENQFFIIDSDCLNEVEERFYGYTIVDNELVLDESFTDEDALEGFGAYLLVRNTQNEVRISQDFYGCWGLYLYQCDDYFAISNSFIKLAEYLKSRQKITYNKLYADAFLFAHVSTFYYSKTLINEITVIPKNYKVIIDKNEKSFRFEKIDYAEQSIDIDSKEGIEVLDSWYSRWVELIRSLKTRTNNISIDLSGGLDSRIVAALWLTSDIDFSKIRIKSHNDNLSVHGEDFKIAFEIAEEFGFELNNHSCFSYHQNRFEDISTSLKISSYVKLGFHKQFYYKLSRASEPVITITGNGGGSMRGYPNQLPEKYMRVTARLCRKGDSSLVDATKLAVEKSWEGLLREFDVDRNSTKLTEIHYKEVRGRNHFGKSMVESAFSNWITLTPLIDPELYMLKLNSSECEDTSLLFALIMKRYCPKLLDFEIQGGRTISQDTLEFADELNSRYPFKAPDNEHISGPEITRPEANVGKGVKKEDIESYLEEIFLSKPFELEFKKYFTVKSYKSIEKMLKNEKFIPLRHVYSAIAILRVIDLTEYGKSTNREWLDSFIGNDNYDQSELHLREKKLRKENRRLKKELKQIKNSKSWKMTHAFRRVFNMFKRK
jgi:asparagine synthetase B (glutamine-hydrolysing)